MTPHSRFKAHTIWLLATWLLALLFMSPARAALTSLNDEPVPTQASLLSAPPNIMYILDDSGSMDWDYMPGPGVSSQTDILSNTNTYGYKSPQCNGLAYDPTQIYAPPVKWNGVSYPPAIYTAAWTHGFTPRFANGDAYASTGVSNSNHSVGSKTMRFTTETGLFPFIADVLNFFISIFVDTGLSRIVDALPGWGTGTLLIMVDQSDSTYWLYGTVSSKTSAKVVDRAPLDFLCLIYCKIEQNYTVNVTFFTGKDNAINTDWFINTPASTNLGTRNYYNYTGTQPKMAWTYTSAGLTDTSTTFATQCAATSGSSVFTSVSVTSSSAEAQNYANWYQYYRTRLLLMKTASGRAFQNVPSSYRVGVTKISHSQYSSINSNFFLGVAPFTEDAASTAQGQKFNFYVNLYNSKFYDRDAATTFNGQRSTSFGTPLRLSLNQVGKYYANKISGQSEPMTAACQRNYALMSTDGYWNDSSNPTGLNGVAIGNQDGSPELRPMFDDLSTSNTLADVSAYYYATDIRDPAYGNCGSGLCTNDTTATTDRGVIGRQNMVTYTLGLGVGGTLTYDKNYPSQTSGDYKSLTTGAKTWPLPTSNTAKTVDDLWHTAVNGRGRYFAAQNVADLSSALETTLSSVTQQTGTGSAAATSAFQLISGDTNYVYKGSYLTSKWIGELTAYPLSSDGLITSVPAWTAQGQIDTLANRTGRTAPASGVTPTQCSSTYSDCADERVIYFMHPSTKALKAFTYSELSLAGLDSFSNSCGLSKLSQCSALTAAQKTLVNNGRNFVNYLRGDATYETTNGSNPLFRLRQSALGDIANSAPAFVGKPPFKYSDAGYSAFVSAQALRTKMVFVAANDGMLHAINATTGKEAWAFVPNAVMPNLYKLADKNYSHQYYVDGSPVVADIKVGSNWKTILVGGLNKGGQAYYALDVTDPTTPIPLWQFTHSNLGYTYGNPIITKNAAGEWIVVFASGYNNTATGLGYLFMLDAYTGASKSGSPIATSAGSVATPSGLAPINAWLDANTDNTARRIYGADLLGNVWRFNIDTATVAPVVTLKDATGGNLQPITVKPETSLITYNGSTYPILLIGTGKYLHQTDVSSTALQSIYAIKDKLDTAGWGDIRATASNLVSKSFTTSGSGTSLTRTATSSSAVDWATKAGWVVDLRPSSTGTLQGERVVTNMEVAYSTLVVASNIPSSSASCTAAGGTSWLYFFSLASGFTDVAPMYQGNTMISGVSVVYDSTGRPIVITNTTDGKTTKQRNAPSSTTNTDSGTVKRISWRELVN